MPHVLLLPGWQNSGAAHWQSRWEHVYGYTRVEQHDWQRPLRGDWVARLEDELLLKMQLPTHISQGLDGNLAPKYGENHCAEGVLPAGRASAPRSAVLVAHSLGCHLVAAWAAASRNTHFVKAALLVAPPDVAREDLPADLYNWRQPVLHELPFPSVCVVSSNDPFSSVSAGKSLANAWGAQCIELGAYGHINGDSGLGDWPEGHALLTRIRHQRGAGYSQAEI